MKLLVTGGLGFIGSNFIRKVLATRSEIYVTNLDAMTYAGNPENLRDVEKNPKYQFVKGNICDKRVVDALVPEHDVIVSFAAESHVDRSILDPEAFVRTDVLGTYMLLNAARHAKIKKFILISTDETYGSINHGKFTEDSPLMPNSPYAASKASADLLALSFYATYKLPVTITRTCNNFGPFHHPEKLIPLFITNLLEGKKVPLYGSGLNVREWIFVEDNVDAIMVALDKGLPGKVYNIGTDVELTNLEVAKAILVELHKDESWIEYVKDRSGHDLRYALDSSRIRALGWAPKHDFSSALRRTVQWYKENFQWWQKVKSGEFKEYYQKQYEAKV